MGSSDRDWRPTRFISLVLLFRFEPRLIVSPWLGHNQIFNIAYDMVVTPGRWVWRLNQLIGDTMFVIMKILAHVNSWSQNR